MRKLVGVVLMIVSGFAATSLQAQPCNDVDQCTANDMCADRVCVGTPVTGDACDDFSPCTEDDTCLEGECVGTALPDGTLCDTENVCRRGSCRNGVCKPDEDTDGECDDGNPCTINDGCQFGSCFGELVVCPDADGDPCTLEFCNTETGQCEGETAPACDECEICNPENPEEDLCEPASGMPCNDFNQCTGDGQCEDGECVTLGPCDGDCNGDDKVAINELVLGVGIALETQPFERCPFFDQNANEKIEINELIAGVNAALRGCTGPP